MKAMHFLVIIGFISSALAKDPVYLNNAQKLDDVSLDATCSPPTRLGGLGYCGLGYCEYAEKWSCTGSGKCAVCSFLKGKNQQGLRYDISKPLDYQMYLDRVTSYDCPNGQSKDARCTSEALAALIKGPGIKAAYCNDQFLVVHSDLTSNYPSWISDIPNPPGGGEGHTNMEQTLTHIFCQMGTESMYPAYGYYKFPLKTTLLKGSHYRNNMNLQAYPAGPTRNSAAGYLSSQLGAGHDYGLPTRGPVGLTIAGQEIFPVFNNNAYLEPQKCEVDSCNAHIGQDGGQSHLHGDPFGAWCLYDQHNYSYVDAHPPQIGWVFDGLPTYGRHLDHRNLGYRTPLDQCGGHEHDDLGYHYHAQILEALTDGGRYNPPGPNYDDLNPADIPYLATTTGPWQCFKGDISLIPNFWSGWVADGVVSNVQITPDTTYSMCYDTTDYYVLDGYSLPLVSSKSQEQLAQNEKKWKSKLSDASGEEKAGVKTQIKDVKADIKDLKMSSKKEAEKRDEKKGSEKDTKDLKKSTKKAQQPDEERRTEEAAPMEKGGEQPSRASEVRDKKGAH